MTSSSAPASIDGRTARWAGQRQRRRDQFVEAALRAIAEHGPDVPVERIAEQAEVGRTRLYKYFADIADLQGAIADRAAELITTNLAPVWDPRGTPTQMIGNAVDAHLAFLTEHGNLYRYLTMHSLSGRDGREHAVTDVRTTVAHRVTELFEYYLGAFGGGTRTAETLAFGAVGLVEAGAARWLEHPGDTSRAELVELLTRWVWRLVDDELRAAGVELDPHRPLPDPDPPKPSPPATAPAEAG